MHYDKQSTTRDSVHIHEQGESKLNNTVMKQQCLYTYRW